jgi:hypothetical protein
VLASVTAGGNICGWARSGETTTSSSPGSATTAPRHVHVYRDGKLVLKWNLDASVPMKGRPTGKLIRLIRSLRKDGLL